jgi:hypothetical protein
VALESSAVAPPTGRNAGNAELVYAAPEASWPSIETTEL